jgi:hypothetical protein
MEKKKDIGKIFREQIDLLNKEPNNDGWNKIQLELDKRKKRRFLFIPFWLKTIGLLTAGVVSFWLVTNTTFVNDSFFKTTNSSDLKTTDKQQTSSENTNSKDDSAKSESTNGDVAIGDSAKSKTNTTKNENDAPAKNQFNSANKKNSIQKSLNQNSTTSILAKSNLGTNTSQLNSNTNTAKKKTATINKSYHSKKKKKIESDQKNTDKTESFIANKDIDNSLNSASNTDKNKVEKSLKQNENKTVKVSTSKNIKKVTIEEVKKDSIQEPKKNKNTIEVFVYGSPTISGFSSNKSLLDARLDNNSTSSDVTFSYGAYVCFQGTSDFSLRFGIGMINLDLTTKNALVNTTNYTNIEYDKGYSNSFIYSQSNNSEYMNITQSISYLEIPVEVKYRFLDRKIDLNAIVGVNFLSLKNNTISVFTSDGSTFKIGDTTNLLDNTLGLNIGMGFEYNLNQKIKFNVEPMFKYHFQNSNSKNETSLYSINVLAGLQIKLGK